MRKVHTRCLLRLLADEPAQTRVSWCGQLIKKCRPQHETTMININELCVHHHDRILAGSEKTSTSPTPDMTRAYVCWKGDAGRFGGRQMCII